MVNFISINDHLEKFGIINIIMKTFKTTATLKKNNQLILDSPIPEPTLNGKVKLIILFPDKDDINEKEWLEAASTNPAFDFLNDSREDIYSENDGQPFHDKG